MMHELAIALALVAAACSNKDAAPRTCKPLSVTVDGQSLPALAHGLARANVRQGETTYEVQLFDRAGATCDELLGKAGRHIAEDEISVRAFAGGTGMAGKGVSLDAHTQMGGDVWLASGKPAQPGQTVQVCTEAIDFVPHAGLYKGKRVAISGMFEGTYCGEKQW